SAVPSTPGQMWPRSPQESRSTRRRRRRDTDSHHVALLGGEHLAAPRDAIRGETSEPNHKIDYITYRYQVHPTPQNVVADAPYADEVSHSEAQDQIAAQESSVERPRPRQRRGQNSPRKAVRKQESEIRERPAQPHRSRPANLVLPKAGGGLRGVHGPHR